DSTPDELVQAVRVVAGGDSLLAPRVTRALIADFVARPERSARDDASLAALTEREIDVLLLVARGLANREIAKELVMAEQTVKSHVSRMLSKLMLRDRTQLVVAAYESGLVRAGR
ncbi:MAG: response regulator transcription factor, partial [Brachybacterium tyrofermentans]